MIVTINGSGKPKGSNSAYFLSLVKNEIQDGYHVEMDYQDFYLSRKDGIRHTAEGLMNCAETCDRIIFAMPLFVDGVPSTILTFFQMVDSLDENKLLRGKKVYVIANCGFYEGEQTRNLLDIMQCWCEKKGMIWGRGIGIGAGEMMGSMKGIPLGKGPTKNLKTGIARFADNVRNGESGAHLYVTPNLIPRFLFIKFANQFWNRMSKKKGLTKRDLWKKAIAVSCDNEN